MTSSSLLAFFIVVLITSVTPGAGVLYTIRNAVTYGTECAYLSPTGNALGVLFMNAAAATGLGALIHGSPAAFIAIQSIGALVLLWFGYKSWSAPLMSLGCPVRRHAQNGRRNKFRILSSAALLQLTNPVLIVFLLSLMPQFIDPNAPYISQITLLIGIFVGTCWLVHLAYSYSAAAAASRWMNERFSFYLNKTSALLFWLCSASILWKICF